jgi:hypothetical protein
MNTARTFIFAAAAVVAAGAASAQTATTPWVLDRSSTAAMGDSRKAQEVVERFGSVYAKAGRPRIALFWNRDLSDRLANDQREALRVQGSTYGDGFSLAATRGTETDREPARRTSLTERDLWQVETEFTRRLLDAGVVLIDRATIMRLTAGSGSTANAQAIEMAALVGKADLFLEVLLTADPSAPLGWGFRSNLKDVKSGRVVGSQYLAAMPELPPPAAASYRARPGGYERVEAEPAKVTVRAIGETLALDSMQELTRRLAAR